MTFSPHAIFENLDQSSGRVNVLAKVGEEDKSKDQPIRSGVFPIEKELTNS